VRGPQVPSILYTTHVPFRRAEPEYSVPNPDCLKIPVQGPILRTVSTGSEDNGIWFNKIFPAKTLSRLQPNFWNTYQHMSIRYLREIRVTEYSKFEINKNVTLSFITIPISVPEFIDPVFVKTSPKRSFSVIQNERFGLVFGKTGSIISGTDL
jgi:hypothetical protein